MSSSITILTGASRGLGAAMAEQLLLPDSVLLCISRHASDALAAKAAGVPMRLEQWKRDLADPVSVAEQIELWLGAFDPARCDAVTLINNAGVLARVGPLDASTNAELSVVLRVGLEAALLLTAAFLRATLGWRAREQGHCKVLNISSGLGRRPMAASAAYCAVKAGMDHFSRAVALDEAHRGSGAKIVALAPGVIDTDMQVHLRAADSSGFPEQHVFMDLQSQGQLATPHDAAARVLAYLRRDDFGSTPVADIRE